MRTYRVLLPLTVHTEDGSYTQGETFEKEFAAEDELENVQSGLLAIEPGMYKVVGTSIVDGHHPGEEFESDMTQAREQLLAGHVERVEPKPAPKTRKKKEAGN